jgi:hypothetical protein
MSDLFEDKSAMPGNANIKMASDAVTFPLTKASVASDKPVRVSQTLNERYADRADDAMSVRNLSRPRRGHDY